MPEFGREGVARIARARVLMVGAGGLGSAALPYLAGAGVGTITLYDGDTVDRTNLHRQVLYRDADVGHAKALVAARALQALNPEVVVHAHAQRLEADAMDAVVADHDLVIDGSDNHPTKYALNDAALRTGRPLVYASVTAMDALATLVLPGETACLRCLFPEPPTGPEQSCATVGVLGPLVGMTGSLQALEALKWLSGNDELETLAGRLWTLDAREFTTRTLLIQQRPGCLSCAAATRVDR